MKRVVENGNEELKYVKDMDIVIRNVLTHYRQLKNDATVIKENNVQTKATRKRKIVSSIESENTAHGNQELIDSIVELSSELMKWLYTRCKKFLYEMLTDEHTESPNKELFSHAFICPISLKIMEDPVLLSDGHTYEREAITRWLSTKNTSPKTNQRLENRNIIPNQALKMMIEEYIERKKKEYFAIDRIENFVPGIVSDSSKLNLKKGKK